MENQIPESQTQESQQQAGQPMIITLADLDMIRQIIELAANRGSFQAGEMENVGAVYNKLAAFLNMAAEQAKAEQDSAEAPAQDNSQAPQGE